MGNINSTFIALISKVDHLDSYDDYQLIFLCNMVDKIIAKIIAMRIKPLLSRVISTKQFGFLNHRHIHEVVGSSQEALHTVKTQKILIVVMKIDLSKAYVQVS